MNSLVSYIVDEKPGFTLENLYSKGIFVYRLCLNSISKVKILLGVSFQQSFFEATFYTLSTLN